MRAPLHLFKDWNRVVSRIARADRVILLSDFDGTLVPIQSNRNKVRLPEQIRRLLRSIAAQGHTLGIISGRCLDDLPSRIGIPDIWYAGSHGYFLQNGEGNQISLLSEAALAKVKKLALFLRLCFRTIPGFEVEAKKATVAVHYRHASGKSVSLGYGIVRRLLGRRKDLRLLCGKKVWEILPDQNITKWSAVRVILDREGFLPSNTLAMYLGDDVTDEAVFRNLRGISVAVGKASRTAAEYWLSSPAQVREFFRRWPAPLNRHLTAQTH